MHTPTDDDRAAALERFFDEVFADLPIDEATKALMRRESVPRLPDHPTPLQRDAWLELGHLVADRDFLARTKRAAAHTYAPGFDHVAFQMSAEVATVAARGYIARGVDPGDADVQAIVDDYVKGYAVAAGRPDDDTFRAEMRERFGLHDARTTRFWRLVGVLHGQPPAPEWEWLVAAVNAHC